MVKKKKTIKLTNMHVVFFNLFADFNGAVLNKVKKEFDMI